MTTLDSLVDDVYGMLYGVAHVERPVEDTLATGVAAASDTSWRFTTTTMWSRGDYAEGQDAGELVILAEDHPAAADVTVRRAQRSTTAASSYSTGDVFYRNPMFPRYVVEKAVQETIDVNLWPHVWSTATGSFAYTSGDTTYALPADCEEVSQVYQMDLSGTGEVAPFPRSWWEVMHGVDTGVEATGRLLRLFKTHDSNFTVYYTYKQRPRSADIANTVSDEMAWMIPWKAAAKVMAGHRIVPKSQAGGRSQSEGGDRPIRDYVFFDTEFRRMLEDERLRLRRRVREQARYSRGVRRG